MHLGPNSRAMSASGMSAKLMSLKKDWRKLGNGFGKSLMILNWMNKKFRAIKVATKMQDSGLSNISVSSPSPSPTRPGQATLVFSGICSGFAAYCLPPCGTRWQLNRASVPSSAQLWYWLFGKRTELMKRVHLSRFIGLLPQNVYEGKIEPLIQFFPLSSCTTARSGSPETDQRKAESHKAWLVSGVKCFTPRESIDRLWIRGCRIWQI